MPTAKDILDEQSFNEALDPRPVHAGHYSKNFIRYLQHSGFLAQKISPEMAKHLAHKVDGYIRSAILADRLGRIGIDPFSDKDE